MPTHNHNTHLLSYLAPLKYSRTEREGSVNRACQTHATRVPLWEEPQVDGSPVVGPVLSGESAVHAGH